MGKHKIKLHRRVLEALDLPEDATGEITRITMVGQEHLLIENHKGIYEYGKTVVRLAANTGTLVIQGDALELLELSSQRLYVAGHIVSAGYE